MKNPIIAETKFKASDCGNSFKVDYFDGTYKYWYSAGNYYSQRITPALGVANEISKDDFLQACQFLKENISLCGSSFSVWNTDGVSGNKFWFDGIYFYKQAFGALVKSMPVKILKSEYITACSNRF